MSYHTTKTRQQPRRSPLDAVGLWDSRRAGQTMPEPVINRAYVPGLAYESGIPGTIATTPNTLRGLGDCIGCHGVGAVPPPGVHYPPPPPPEPVVAAGAIGFVGVGLGLLLGVFVGYKMCQKHSV